MTCCGNCRRAEPRTLNTRVVTMPKLNIKIYRNLMGANDKWAQRTRALLKKHHVIMLNLIGSPGAIVNTR